MPRPIRLTHVARIASTAAIVAACGGAPAQPGTESDDLRLVTEDGLAIAFNRDTSRFDSLSGPGWRIDLAAFDAHMGVSLADHHGAPLLDPRTVPVAEFHRRRDTLQVVRQSPESGLIVTESWTAHPRYIDLEASIVEVAPPATAEPSADRSRALEACVTVPMDLMGKRWHGHLHQSETIEPGRTYQTVLVESLDIGHYSPSQNGSHLKTTLPINLHGVSAVGDDQFGLAVAMHPDAPASYYTAYDTDARALRACFHLAIYRDHATRPDRTSLRLVLFAVDDPAWGLRSALDEYTAIFPTAFRGRLGERQTGMTVGGGYDYRQSPAPERFHISAMWNAFKGENLRHNVANLLYAWPTGYIDRGVRLRARPVTGPCAECDRSMDAQVAACLRLYQDYEDGLVRFPETCDDTWGQKGCRQSPVAPVEERTYGPVRIRHEFYDLVPNQVVAPTHLALRLFGKFAMHEPFVASILRGRDGRYDGALSDSHTVVPVGSSKDIVTCSINGLNPDPGALVARELATRSRSLSGQPRNQPGQVDNSSRVPPVNLENFGQLNLEIAKRATGAYGDAYVYVDQEFGPMRYDGVALDTVGAYLRPDFHDTMLRVATYPLAYDPETGRAVALEHLSLTAFLRELDRTLPKGKAIAINGYPIAGTLGQGVDHFVRELARRYRKLPGDQAPRYYYELYDEDEATRLRRAYRARMVAYQRPITFWARFLLTEERARSAGTTPDQTLLADMQRYLPLYTAKGIYVFIQRTGVPGRDRFLSAPQEPRAMALYEKHLDTVHALTRAGWQPVPYAAADDPAISIDRFGQDFITLYNTDAGEKRASVRIQWSKIDSANKLARVRDFETGRDIPITMDRGAAVVAGLAVPAYGARVLVLATDPPE